MREIDVSELDNPSLGNIVEERARRDGDDVLLLFEDQEITCAELDENMNRAANGLLRLGVQKGDMVCLCLPNCPEWPYLWLGMAKIGAVLVPIMPGLSGAYLTHVVNHSDARTVITHASLLGAFDAVADELENVKTFVVDVRGSSAGSTELPPGALPMEQLFDSPAGPPGTDVGHPDISHIVYTSGTTGFPKGLVVRHPSAERVAADAARWDDDIASGEVVYTCYPLHTSFAGFRQYLTQGIVVSFSREKRVEMFWDNVRRYNAVAFNYYVDLIPSLLAQPERENDRDNPARFCTGIMAPTAPGVVAAFENRFNVRVIEGYGSVEGGGVTTNRDGKGGSIGKPRPDLEVKIVDDDGNEVGPYEMGEIIHRRTSGEPIEVEYYKMPEQSAAKMRGGWCHSYDLAYKDEEGYFYFADRKLDVITKGGRQILASAIEAVVSQNDSVAECVAFGVACGPQDDEIKLCVILEEGTSLEPEALLGFCQERLDAHMVPKYIEFKDSFPRGSRAKVQKNKLRAEGIKEETWDSAKAARHGRCV